MQVVIALGGNALLQRGQPLEADVQLHNITVAAQAIAEVAKENRVVVTHGNGPQVGLLALQSAAYKNVQPYPLDVLNAESEGMIGYLLSQQLYNYLPGCEVVTLLTQVEVDIEDPAFANPTKPIGPLYTQAQAEKLAAESHWQVAPDGNLYRRVVPSPTPRRIIELATIKLLVKAGSIVVCVGGGGIPVVVTPLGVLRGVEAVIDKDFAAALLAEELEADALLLLTDVDAVYTEWGSPDKRPLLQVTPQQLKNYTFDPGSMAPKVEAACKFVDATGHFAAIGKLGDARKILAGDAGTTIINNY
ncbi:carbamate kinase [Mastigocoleus sp. MO_188.B34]|uniref:carbamate kinase n=1 Tax=Mastigocoleus sp. MO_188.B34 TaxID=3036635 RepID=UPI002634EDAC|nr:carbamate kinase [Mastigocoleus sp. MO_188.B34]MDJ0694567.1 carbamate kinase [Mastigocoleus sp. MO_188.B34]